MSSAATRGAWGEALARLYLEHRGYRFLAQRYRLPGGEIDLVMADGDRLVFVEVKTRGPAAAAAPEAWVDGRKLRLMRRAARQYLARQPRARGTFVRFDVIGISLQRQGRGLILEHFRGVG